MRILDMARSIGLALSDSDKATDLYAAIGQAAPDAPAASSGFRSWQQDRLSAFRGRA